MLFCIFFSIPGINTTTCCNKPGPGLQGRECSTLLPGMLSGGEKLQPDTLRSPRMQNSYIRRNLFINPVKGFHFNNIYV